MAIYSSKYAGYKFIINPKRRKKKSDGSVEIDNGKIAVFRDGRFQTEDPEITRKLDAYAHRHPDEIARIDKQLEKGRKIQNIIQKAKEDINKETQKIPRPDIKKPIVKSEKKIRKRRTQK